ncbi:hypothetical protein FOA52_004515 [Chlamydomonas sp. UWO 241]|nr:hypothetical protein FOA52_004515 [Chlamydomonas sp. UWO 241]
MFLGLLFKAMKTDVCDKRVSAMSKRLLQSAHNAAPNFACAVLFMLSEVLKAHPALWSGILQQEDTGSGLEAFADVDVDSDDGGDGDKAAGKDEEEAEAEAGGDDDDDTGDMQLDAARPASGGAPSKAPASSAKATDAWPAEDEYDMAKREPLFANADRACWWELTSLASHAHPSVSAMARTLMSGQPMLYYDGDLFKDHTFVSLTTPTHPPTHPPTDPPHTPQPVLYDGDPLKDHTLVSFLDKFLAKKPRSHARGSSLMQPLGGVGAATGQRSLADLSSSAFAALAESKVRVRGGVLAFAAHRRGGGGAVARGDAWWRHGILLSPQPFIHPSDHVCVCERKRCEHARTSPLPISPNLTHVLTRTQVEPADLFFHKFVNLGNVKSKREKRDEERAAKEAAGGDDSDDPDDGEPDSEEIDRILEPAEKALDDDLGDPDIGYSYADLGRAMEDDEDLMADDEEGVAMGDGGEEGEAEEEEAEEGEDGEDGLEYALDAMSDSGSEGGGEDDDDGDNVSDDDSDSDGEFELAPGAAEYLAAAEAAAAGTSKKKKGAKAKALPTVSRAVDGDAEPGSEDIEREGLTFMDLPSASDSEGEEEEGEEEDEDGDSMEGNEFEGMSSDEDEDGAGGEEGDDDEEMDDDAFAALMRGRAGSDSDEGGDGGEGDEEEGVEAAPGHKRGASAVAVGSAKADGKPGKPAKRADGKRADGKPVKRAKKSPDDVFAPADEYDEFFNTHTKSLEQRHEGKEVGSVRPGGRGGGAKRGGGGGRSGRGGREGGGRGRVGRRS